MSITSQHRRPLAAVRLLALGFLCVPAFSQQPLYNKQQDDKAKAAVALLPDLKSSALFQRQLHNADVLAQQETARFLQEAKRLMRSTIDGFIHWSDIDDLIRETKEAMTGGSVASAETEKARLKKQKEEAENAAAALKKQASDAGPDIIATVLAQSDKLKPASEYAQKLLGETVLTKERLEAIAEIGNALEQIGKAYEAQAKNMEEIRKKQKELAELAAPLRQISLDLLQVEIDYWANVAKIRERREEEWEDTSALVKECETLLANLRAKKRAEPKDAIAQTVASTMNTPEGGDVLLTLHCAAALAARGQTPGRLALLRLGREHHLHVIRRSAVRARAVELTVTSGVQRIALLYQGGIKTTQIAQLFHTLAAIATPPVIAAQ
jgi:hypothetical protein